MYHTQVRPVRDLRNNYPELAHIVQTNDHVIITNNGKSESVLISFDEFQDYEEFVHHSYVKKMLKQADAQFEDDNTTLLSHDDFWETVKAL